MSQSAHLSLALILRRRARHRLYYAVVAAFLMFAIIGLGFYLFAAIGTERSDNAAITLAKERENVAGLIQELNTKSDQLHNLKLMRKAIEFAQSAVALSPGERPARVCIGRKDESQYELRLKSDPQTYGEAEKIISNLLHSRVPQLLQDSFTVGTLSTERGSYTGSCLLFSQSAPDASAEQKLDLEIKALRASLAEVGYEPGVIQFYGPDETALTLTPLDRWPANLRVRYSEQIHKSAFDAGGQSIYDYVLLPPLNLGEVLPNLYTANKVEAKTPDPGPKEAQPATLYGIPEILSRITLVVLIVLVVQTVVSVFRYTMRLSAFYDARADALQIRDELKLTTSSEASFAQLVAALSPDTYDFGRMPKSPVEHAVEIAKAVIEKTGK